MPRAFWRKLLARKSQCTPKPKRITGILPSSAAAKLHAIGVVDVDHGHRFFAVGIGGEREEPLGLGLIVGVERAVVVEVVLGQVGEHAGVEADARQTRF